MTYHTKRVGRKSSLASCHPQAGTTQGKMEIPLTGKRRMGWVTSFFSFLGHCTKNLTQFTTPRDQLRHLETDGDKEERQGLPASGMWWSDHDSQWPTLQRTTRAFAVEDLNNLWQCCGLHSLHHWGSRCRTQYTALQRTPAAFATEETNGQHSCCRLPKDFTTEGSTCFCVHRPHMFESLPTPPARVILASSTMDALGPGIHVSRQPWPLLLHKCTMLVQASVVNPHSHTRTCIHSCSHTSAY